MSDEPPKYPRIGVGVLLLRPDGSFVVGRRKSSHGAGQLALPGGALEWRESLATCASRETLEECGLVIDERAWTIPRALAESVIDERNHWLTVFASCDVAADATPENREPHKCEGWSFTTMDAVREMIERDPESVFLPLRLLATNGAWEASRAGSSPAE